MSNKNRTVNPGGGPTAAELAGAREQLGRLRAAIRGKRHWIFATDEARAALGFRSLAVLLVMNGAGEGDVLLVEPELHVLGRAVRVELTVFAVTKSVLTADHVAHFLAGLTGGSEPVSRARLAGGRDIFPIGTDTDMLAGFIDQVQRGVCFVQDTASN